MVLSKPDFYKELKLRGYQYVNDFQVVTEIRGDASYSKLKWNKNWVTFLDGLLQTQILGSDSRSIQLPTRVRKMIINPREMAKHNSEVDVFYNRHLNMVSCKGVEMIGMNSSSVQRRKPAEPVLETYKFVPNSTPELAVLDAAKVCVQLYLENIDVQKMVVLEIDNGTLSIEAFSEAIEMIPLVKSDLYLKSNTKVKNSRICLIEGTQFPQACNFIITHEFTEEYSKLLIKDGFFIIKSHTGTNETPEGYKRMCEQYIPEGKIYFTTFQKQPILNNLENLRCVEVISSDKIFPWMKKVQDLMASGHQIMLVSQMDSYSGLLGLVNTLRKEPNGHLIRAVYINDSKAAKFNLGNILYRKQIELGLAINVLQNVSI